MPLSEQELHGYAKRMGRQIRTLRKAKNLTQQELADLAGLHGKFLGAVERGETTLTLSRVFQLAAALGVSIATILEPFGKFSSPLPNEELIALIIDGLNKLSSADLFALYSYSLFLQGDISAPVDNG